MSHSSLPEAVAAARSGGTAEIESFLAAAWPDVYRLAFSVLGNSQAAQDAAQDACIILYRSIASLRETGAFRVWMYRIVVRAAMDVKRRRDVQELACNFAPVSDSITKIDVWRALAVLPAHMRNAVVLRYFEDLSSREIASVLRVPDATVRFWLASARRKLRPLLEVNDSSENTEKVEIHAI